MNARAEITLMGESLRVQAVNEDGTWVMTNDHADEIQVSIYFTDLDLARIMSDRNDLRMRQELEAKQNEDAILRPE